jgi:hypothetical protein
VTTKLVIWIQPRSPLLSRLSGCRRRSNPAIHRYLVDRYRTAIDDRTASHA